MLVATDLRAVTEPREAGFRQYYYDGRSEIGRYLSKYLGDVYSKIHAIFHANFFRLTTSCSSYS